MANFSDRTIPYNTRQTNPPPTKQLNPTPTLSTDSPRYLLWNSVSQSSFRPPLSLPFSLHYYRFYTRFLLLTWPDRSLEHVSPRSDENDRSDEKIYLLPQKNNTNRDLPFRLPSRVERHCSKTTDTNTFRVSLSTQRQREDWNEWQKKNGGESDFWYTSNPETGVRGGKGRKRIDGFR